jgi:drug/metabolite transporter (DMT)-like permease
MVLWNGDKIVSSEAFILMALACWGFWGIFEKKALGFANCKEVLIALYLLNTIQIPIIAGILNTTKPHWHLTSESLFWSGLASLTYAIAMLAYLRALSKSDASYVLGTTACYPVISLLLATPFLGEHFSLLRFSGSLLVALGIFAIGLPNGKKEPQKPLSNEVKICVFIAAFAWGLWGIIDKKALSIADPLEITMGKYLWDAVFLIFIVQTFRAMATRSI